MRYHLTPVRMGIIRKSTNNKCWRECGERGTLLHCWWECKLIQPLWRTIWRFLKNLNIELPYYPLLGISAEETIIQKDTWRERRRWQKSKTRRSPSSPQIHQKYIYMWKCSNKHPLNAGRRPQTSQKARNSPRTWVGQNKKEITETKE